MSSKRHHIPLAVFFHAEILREAVRNNQKLKGIQIWGGEFKSNHLADDTSKLLNDSDATFHEALNTLGCWVIT